jgi:hypothetical protein
MNGSCHRIMRRSKPTKLAVVRKESSTKSPSERSQMERLCLKKVKHSTAPASVCHHWWAIGTRQWTVLLSAPKHGK